MGCWGSMQVIPATPAAPAKPAEQMPPPKAPGDMVLNQGKVIIEVPENAKLYVDNQLIKTPAGRRTFNTPTLQPGQAYFYVFRLEMDVNGKSQSETKQVIVRAGQSSEVAFPELIARTKQPAPAAASAQ
jgi:uncharacterized protein (TIGR03000 family)